MNPTIIIDVVNGVSGNFQVWDYATMTFMDKFTGQVEAQLFWVSYDHNDGFEDWGITKNPERERNNGYRCKQVYLADFPEIAKEKNRTKEELAQDMVDEIETILYSSIHDAGCSIKDTMPSIRSIVNHYIINGGIKPEYK